MSVVRDWGMGTHPCPSRRTLIGYIRINCEPYRVPRLDVYYSATRGWSGVSTTPWPSPGWRYLWDVVGTSNLGADACAAAAGPFSFSGADLLVEHVYTVRAAPCRTHQIRGRPPGTATSWDDKTEQRWWDSDPVFHWFMIFIFVKKYY